MKLLTAARQYVPRVASLHGMRPSSTTRLSPVTRCLSNVVGREVAKEEQDEIGKHFRATTLDHPLKTKDAYLQRERNYADKFGRQQNHIWSATELQAAMQTASDKHTPVTMSDKLMFSIMYYGMYHPFNFLTGYRHADP